MVVLICNYVISFRDESLNKFIFFDFYCKEFLKHIRTRHTYHLVDPSPWPILASLGALMLTMGFVLYMHKYHGGMKLTLTGLALIIFVMFVWWRDIIREATLESQHTPAVQRGLRLGMVLFIVSKLCFSLLFFGHFFIQVFLQRLI